MGAASQKQAGIWPGQGGGDKQWTHQLHTCSSFASLCWSSTMSSQPLVAVIASPPLLLLWCELALLAAYPTIPTLKQVSYCFYQSNFPLLLSFQITPPTTPQFQFTLPYRIHTHTHTHPLLVASQTTTTHNYIFSSDRCPSFIHYSSPSPPSTPHTSTPAITINTPRCLLALCLGPPLRLSASANHVPLY